MKEPAIHELVFSRGINLAKTPTWERRGAMVYRKDGRVVQDLELPPFRTEDGKRLLAQILERARAGSRD